MSTCPPHLPGVEGVGRRERPQYPLYCSSGGPFLGDPHSVPLHATTRLCAHTRPAGTGMIGGRSHALWATGSWHGEKRSAGVPRWRPAACLGGGRYTLCGMETWK